MRMIYNNLEFVLAAFLLTLILCSEVRADFEIWPGKPQLNRHKNHRQCEQHYDACLASVTAYGHELTRLQTELAICTDTPSAAVKGLCTRWVAGTDGPGKFLWKPDSERYGKPVVLLPAEYWGLATPELYDIKGAFVSKLKPRACCANGNRGHWDALSLLPKSAILKVVAPDGATECRIIKDTSKRQD